MNKNSLFIVIEGLDGSGKTSVTRYISNILDKENHGKVKLTFEPHDPSCAGLFIRQVLMKKIRNFSPKILALAFAANRLDHCDREINPWLDSQDGAIIICDRYYLSSLVYQSTGGLDFEKVYDLNDAATKPDIIFFLNVSNKVCYERMKHRNESKELFETNLSQTRKRFHEAITFLKEKKNENIVEIDASGKLEEVANNILSQLYKINPSLKPKQPLLSHSLVSEQRVTTLNGHIPYRVKDAINDLGILDYLKEDKTKEEHLTKIESIVDQLNFNQLGSLFLDHISNNKYEVKEKLPWTELDAYELTYELPGGIELTGVALIIQEKQRYDIILKKAPDIPKMSDFMFVFSPGPAELVTNYYERGIIKYNAETIKEGLFPSIKLVTQKELAYDIWSMAKKIDWENNSSKNNQHPKNSIDCKEITVN
ncbi:dTMP kinase [Flagellimonas sediminis]|uniref:Thymidylate kinase n=1 Tax=Flagellimonas sediminis TaxID=2696468 RepID=A0A6I5KVD4_9FLAO|nr:dTMP kinase [Allomuricauda sediminis]NDV42382.1 dTMP kinase [Allomuricauda sediminis]